MYKLTVRIRRVNDDDELTEFRATSIQELMDVAEIYLSNLGDNCEVYLSRESEG